MKPVYFCLFAVLSCAATFVLPQGARSQNQSSQRATTAGTSRSAIPTDLGPSLSQIQRQASSWQGNLRLFDQSAHLIPVQDTNRPSAVGGELQPGVVKSGANAAVMLSPPTSQGVKDAWPTNADNPPQQNLAGVTYLAAPLEKMSHFGPPRPGEPVFQYQAPYYRNAASAFGGTAAATSSFRMIPPFPGIRISDSAYYLAATTAANKALDLLTAPSRWSVVAPAALQALGQSMSNAAAQSAQTSFNTSLGVVQSYLPNVANEAAAGALGGGVGVVQGMFRTVFLPMALLLLLVGALLTGLKAQVSASFGLMQEDVMPAPVIALSRSIIALVLLASTQLIVSWSIDIGNSMTGSISGLINTNSISAWAQQQLYVTASPSASTAFVPTIAYSSGGKLSAVPPQNALPQSQTQATVFLQGGFNLFNFLLTNGLLVVLGFQEVIMCYLYLLGPIAAVFYAWPDGFNSLFKKTWESWLNGVINCALWRFWWCLVLLVMSTRIDWLQSMGNYSPDSASEMAVFTAFNALLWYVPFQPFQFNPSEMVGFILSQTQVQNGIQQAEQAL